MADSNSQRVTAEDKSENEPQIPSFTSDERFQLSEHLRSRLIECGWRDRVASLCRSQIHKHGIENIRLEQIISEVRLTAKQQVPDRVKMELLEKVRTLAAKSNCQDRASQELSKGWIPDSLNDCPESQPQRF